MACCCCCCSHYCCPPCSLLCCPRCCPCSSSCCSYGRATLPPSAFPSFPCNNKIKRRKKSGIFKRPQTPIQFQALTSSKLELLTKSKLDMITASQLAMASPSKQKLIRERMEKLGVKEKKIFSASKMNLMTPSKIKLLTKSKLALMTPSQLALASPSTQRLVKQQMKDLGVELGGGDAQTRRCDPRCTTRGKKSDKEPCTPLTCPYKTNAMTNTFNNSNAYTTTNNYNGFCPQFQQVPGNNFNQIYTAEQCAQAMEQYKQALKVLYLCCSCQKSPVTTGPTCCSSQYQNQVQNPNNLMPNIGQYCPGAVQPQYPIPTNITAYYAMVPPPTWPYSNINSFHSNTSSIMTQNLRRCGTCGRLLESQ